MVYDELTMEDIIWSAGYLMGKRGSFRVDRGIMVLDWRSSHPGAEEEYSRFANGLGLDYRLNEYDDRGKTTYMLVVRGAQVQKMLKLVWPYLTPARRMDYQEIIDKWKQERFIRP